MHERDRIRGPHDRFTRSERTQRSSASRQLDDLAVAQRGEALDQPGQRRHAMRYAQLHGEAGGACGLHQALHVVRQRLDRSRTVAPQSA